MSILAALNNYYTARSALEKAEADTDRYKWAYYGQEYRDDLREAEAGFMLALDNHVNGLIAKAIAMQEDPTLEEIEAREKLNSAMDDLDASREKTTASVNDLLKRLGVERRES